jgi:hypothetical protein
MGGNFRFAADLHLVAGLRLVECEHLLRALALTSMLGLAVLFWKVSFLKAGFSLYPQGLV